MMSSAVQCAQAYRNLLPTAVRSLEFEVGNGETYQTSFRLCATPGGPSSRISPPEPVAAPGHGEIASGGCEFRLSSEYAPVPDGNLAARFVVSKVAAHFRPFHDGALSL